MARHVFALGLLAFLFVMPGAAVRAEQAYFEGYAGTLPSAPEDLAKTYFDKPEVRRLIHTLERGPVSQREVEKELAGTQTKFSDLLRMKLLAVNRGEVSIAFSYFTADDMRLIHSVAAKYAPALVVAYRSRGAELDEILSRYPVASVSRKRLAFVLLAGFSLNWDGLGLLSEHGYRNPRLIEGPGWHYSFWASEDIPEYSYKGYYWGSSTFPADSVNLDPPLDFSFSSFGDAFSDPRMNFPDLFGLQPQDMTAPVRVAAEALGLRDESVIGMSFKNVIGLSRAREIGAILFAMRKGVRDKSRICAALPGSNRAACDKMLSLLAAAGYVREEGDRSFALLVPVFDIQDKPVVDAAMALSRTAMTAWLKKNYLPIRHDLAGLTALRQHVPYPALFTQIWHELFGLATRELVADGMIEDPYAPDAVWKGSIPAVWRTAIYCLHLR